MHAGGFTVPITIDRITVLAGLLAIIALALFASGVVELARHRHVPDDVSSRPPLLEYPSRRRRPRSR
jgi:hypothetical protein